MFGWYFDVMGGSVSGVWLEDVVFEPVGSGVLLGVGVVCGLPVLSVGLGSRDIDVGCGSVWVVQEPAVIWS